MLLAGGALLVAAGAVFWWKGRTAVDVVRPEHPEKLGADIRALVDSEIATVEAHRDQASAHGYLGLAYEANRLWPEARASYRNAAVLAPDDPNWPYHAAV